MLMNNETTKAPVTWEQFVNAVKESKKLNAELDAMIAEAKS